MVTLGPRVTHEVRNQVPVLAGHDVAADPALLEAVDREGAGNVTSLDVLRALARTEGAADALMTELGAAAGANAALDGALAGLKAQVADLAGATSLEAQHEARRLAGRIAVTLAGTLLVRHAPAAVADGFCASRFGPQAAAGPGVPFGTLPAGLDLAAIIARARAEPAGDR